MGRSERYRTLFSVTMVDVPGVAFQSMNKRVKDRAIRELGEILKSSVRTVDRAVHAQDGTVHRFAAILPETARDGATVFVTRLVAKMKQLLEEHGAGAAAQQIQYDVSVFPGDDADLTVLRDQFSAIDAREHPETALVTPTR
jgi:GGDEF domain-containing protein